MLGLPSLVAAAVSGALSVPAGVLCIESLASLLPSGPPPRRDGPAPRFAILMPAHDEAAGIAKTVTALSSELGPRDRLLVVADNCTDDTAVRAREAGAEVIERRDPVRRGKGYALSFGAQALRDDPPDVVIVMDADCRVEKGTLGELARFSATTGRPAQALYLMHAKEAGGAAGLSAFAFLLRNLVRPLGLARLGLPCQLTGTGMAFPWALYRDAPPTEGNLVEDLQLGHELSLQGAAPLFCENVQVGADFPAAGAASLKQRRRWEHGQLAVLLGTAPRLLAAGLARRDPELLALGLDALVPPLALFVVLQGAVLGGGVVLAIVGGSPVPALIALGGSTALAVGVGAAWLTRGRELLPLRDVLAIPRYVLWKLPLYGSFARRGPHSEWERTERA